MNKKYKLLVASSLVTVMATGCSSYGSRGNTDPQTSVTGASTGGYASQQASQTNVAETPQQPVSCSTCDVNNQATGGRTQQWYVDQWNRQQQDKPSTTATNGRTQQWYIDQYNRSQAAKNQATTTTANGRTQQWYIDQYNRSQAEAKNKASTTTNGRTQQWYIDQYNRNQAKANQTTEVASNGRTKQWYVDQWNRQQQQKKQQATQPAPYVPPKPIVATQPYIAPAPYVPPNPIVVTKPYVAPAPYVPPKPYIPPAPAPKTSTQYVDYTGGFGASTTTTAATPTNKGIYTGSFQQPNQTYTPYTPKTYTGGANSGSTSYTPAAPAASGGSTWTVKKGDTVFSIMRQTGVYWKNIISLNGLSNPDALSPGQVLRLK